MHNITDSKPMQLPLLIAQCPETLFANVFLSMGVAVRFHYRNTLRLTTRQGAERCVRHDDARISVWLRIFTIRFPRAFATITLALQVLKPEPNCTITRLAPARRLVDVNIVRRDPLHFALRGPPACDLVRREPTPWVELKLVETRTKVSPLVPK